jgi:hypothetical protein
MTRKCYLLIGFPAIVISSALSAMGACAQSSQPSKELLLQQQAQTSRSPGRQLSAQPSKEEVLGAMGGGAAQPSKEGVLGAMAAGAAGGGQAPSVPGVSSLCYTCGGSWPVFSGAFPLASGSQPWERQSGCSGDLTPRPDTFPYLCSGQ